MSGGSEYLATVMGELRVLPEVRRFASGPPPDYEGNEDEWREWSDEALSHAETRAGWKAGEIRSRHEDRIENYDLSVEALVDSAEGDEDSISLPSPPDLVACEIEDAARLRDDLGAYVKALTVFAGSGYAMEDYTHTELARLSGATRQTVARWLADDAVVDEVREVVRRKAAEAVRALAEEPVKDRRAAMMLGLLQWYAGEGS